MRALIAEPPPVYGIQAHGLTYEFTRDEALLQQYFVIREQVYVETFNLTDFSTHLDDYDHQDYTHILVVRAEDKIIGGSRLTIHHKATPTRLPMEADDFVLSDIFSDLQLQNKVYAEMTRMVILPEYRKGRNMASYMFWMQFAKTVSEGADYMFSVTPALQGRNNRRHFHDLGYTMKTSNDIHVPDKTAYEGKKMYLAITEIKNQMPIMPQEIERD